MMGQLNVIFVNSHPIQYFAPLYKYLNDHGVKTSCWYCSDENVKGHVDRQFGRKVEWDIPLLDGYDYKFFPNRSFRPSLYNGFFGLFNPGMIRALFREPKSVIVVHGWAYITHVLVIIFARLRGHKVCLRGESPLNQELMRSGTNRLFKDLFLRSFLFLFPRRFLYIGEQNRMFYEYYGVASRKLSFMPYAVDNDRFRKAAAQNKDKRALRTELGLPVNALVYLYAAKLISKKRPMDLIKAYGQVASENKCLVMVGDGDLLTEAREYVKTNNLPSVYFVGFINQSEIPKYYAAADVFVLCSGVGETWGLSVNEAMNFGLPVVVTDVAGCSSDLVKENDNGFVVPCGDIAALSKALTDVAGLKDHNTSKEIINQYSYETIMNTLKTLTA
jgi:glycosyltransferase involved in cell wall biosynthesis